MKKRMDPGTQVLLIFMVVLVILFSAVFIISVLTGSIKWSA